MPPSIASVVHTFEAVAGSWVSVRAPAVSRVMVDPQSEIKIAKNIGEMTFGGRVFVNVVSLKYIGMIYINEGEMCFIPMNVHNELFNGVRQLRWQHLSPVVSTFSTSIRLSFSFFIKHCVLPPSFSLSFCLFLWYLVSFS